VRDSGIGIPDVDKTQIFEAFYRSRNAVGRRGLGLGLSIVHESLILMGGTITVVSVAGEGSSFLVEIPLTDPLQK